MSDEIHQDVLDNSRHGQGNEGKEVRIIKQNERGYESISEKDPS
jgi:hypothetical protein